MMPSHIAYRSSVPAGVVSERFYLGPRLRTLPSGKVTTVRNSGSLIKVTSSSTAGAEVAGVIKFNARNAVDLPWLSGIGRQYSKYRVISARFSWEPVVSTTVSGEICMAMLYDIADINTANFTIDRLMQTEGSRWATIWSPLKSPVVADVSRLALKWYLSGATSGTAAENLQTPFQLAFVAQSSSVSIPLGRVMAEYVVEFTEPVDTTVNA
jgi:hypothetical protein